MPDIRTDSGQTLDDTRVAGVVLAAGMATRMGGSKVVREVGGRPMVRRVVEACLSSRLSNTLVVLGHDAVNVEASLRGLSVRVLMNHRYRQGLSTSVNTALGIIGPECRAALFLHADQPFVTAALIDRILEVFSVSRRPIVRPLVEGRPGNPVLFAAELFPELREETGDRGGRDVIRRHIEDVALVKVDDPLLCLDIDSPDDYERVRRL